MRGGFPFQSWAGIAPVGDVRSVLEIILNLRATNVSESAIAELTTAIPRLRVDRFFPPRPSTENGEWAILPAEVVRELRREANP